MMSYKIFLKKGAKAEKNAPARMLINIWDNVIPKGEGC